jgi:type I restriction enzyme M protein
VGDDTAKRAKLNRSFYGIEKKPLPYLLCCTNLLLNKVEEPNIIHSNSLSRNVDEYGEKDAFDVVLMNPPYGGSEKQEIQQNFPADMRSAETADLFMVLIMNRLKKNGRAAVIVPDGFLFGTGNKTAIKRSLVNDFNLHTIVRLPTSVFSPYTSIATNILFFNGKGEKTKQTWFYRVDMPEGYKHFSKTKPMRLEHLKPLADWWNDRKAIEVDGAPKARSYTPEELAALGFNFDQCGFPQQEEEILPPEELIAKYQADRTVHAQAIDATLTAILQKIRRSGNDEC